MSASGPEDVAKRVDAIIAEVLPTLRATAWTWERLGVAAPPPEELAQIIIERGLHLKSTDRAESPG